MGQIGKQVLKEALGLIERFFNNKRERIDYAYLNAEKDELTIAMSVKFIPAKSGGIIPKLKYKFVTDQEADEYTGRPIDENQGEMFDDDGKSLIESSKKPVRDRRGPVGNKVINLYGGIGSQVKAPRHMMYEGGALCGEQRETVKVMRWRDTNCKACLLLREKEI